MILSFHPCLDADLQIILADRPLDGEIRDAVRRAEAIILPQACTQDLYRLCASCRTPVFPDYGARIRYPGKIGQGRLFREKGIPHPGTRAWRTVGDFMTARGDGQDLPHDFPFILKGDQGHEGEAVFLATDNSSLEETLQILLARERSGLKGFISQDYISCGGNVLRSVVIGRRVISYWKRPCRPGQEITTISRGAVIDREWQPRLREMGKAQALMISRKTGINLAAMDFVFPLSEKDPFPLVLEINYYFGRRGLGGTENYYRLVYGAVQDWLEQMGMDPATVRLV